jgi:hypothetical protein
MAMMAMRCDDRDKGVAALVKVCPSFQRECLSYLSMYIQCGLSCVATNVGFVYGPKLTHFSPCSIPSLVNPIVHIDLFSAQAHNLCFVCEDANVHAVFSIIPSVLVSRKASRSLPSPLLLSLRSFNVGSNFSINLL